MTMDEINIKFREAVKKGTENGKVLHFSEAFKMLDMKGGANMKIGDYVTVQEIADQSECRWVVLSDFEYRDYGGYEDIEGGIIRCIANTKREASKISVKLHLEGTDTLLMSGAIEPLSVGGVFVE